MFKKITHFVNGKEMPGKSGRLGKVYNPATGEATGQVPFANQKEVNFTIEIAENAFSEWAQTPPLQRARVLFRFRELIEKQLDDIAKIITSEHGKIFSDAKGSVLRGLEVVEFACGIPQLLKGDFTENISKGIDSYSIRQPLGVCVGISPFNFPAMVPLWMFPIALACGNSFILKPSEKDPSTASMLAELLKEAGLPAGVFNVLHGDKRTVDTLIQHPEVQAVSFVGSTPVAEHVYAKASVLGKRAQALGGAKNHLVIMPDAPIDNVTSSLMGAAYGSAGERCMAVSVAVAVGDVGDKLVKALKPLVKKLKIGPGKDPNSEMGPLITAEHRDRVQNYIEVGVQEGAELVVDGREVLLQGYESGFFVGGSLFDRVNPEMRIYKEEIFGPVLSVVRMPDFDSALKLVNDHQFGNGAAIFTRDGDAAREFGEGVASGMVGVNVAIPVPTAFHSFGGWKKSIFGNNYMYGMEGVRFFTRLKTLTSRWPKGVREPNFAMPTIR